MAAWGINVGSKLAQGVSKIYSNLFSGSSGSHGSPSSSAPSSYGPVGRGRSGSNTSLQVRLFFNDMVIEKLFCGDAFKRSLSH